MYCMKHTNLTIAHAGAHSKWSTYHREGSVQRGPGKSSPRTEDRSAQQEPKSEAGRQISLK